MALFRQALLAVALIATTFIAGCGDPPSGAPGNLKVSGTNPITLTWDAVSRATSYNIYRGTATGSLSSKTKIGNSTSTSYSDTTATSGTTYYYQVAAVNSDGQSGASSEVSASPSGSSSGFSLSASSTGSGMSLSWNAVTNATSYDVYRGTSASVVSGKEKINTSAVTTTTFTDITAVPGTTYYYQINAINSSNVPFQTSSEASATR